MAELVVVGFDGPHEADRALAELARLQRANDQRLFSNLCHQFNRLLPHPQARLAARGLAAMIDGLWLRGSLVGGQFNADKSRRIAYGYIDFQLQAAAL